ncbi:MAG TPA: 30S ribosome-binding factor RbfA [bacterium]|nr:30S ribosome-binding factor RbfA [bacterium]
MKIENLDSEKKFARSDRVAELLKRAISEIIQNKLKDSRVGFTTVSAVKVSNDLRIANVYVSVFGKNYEKKQTLEALEDSKQFIRTLIGKNVILKYLPDLHFFIDDSLDYSEKMTNIISGIKQQSSENLKKKIGLELTDDDIQKLKNINNRLMNAERILLTTHLRADGDAFGSLMSIYNYLDGLNKKVKVVIDHGCPQYLAWLPDSGLIEDNKNLLIDKNFDLYVCIDSDFEKRVGYPYEIFKDKVNDNNLIVIDHHPETIANTNLKILKTEAAAAAEIIYYFFKVNDIPLNDKIALYLYVGLLTDTWMFSQENTTSTTLYIASELLKFETVQPYQLTMRLFENKTLGQTKLLGKLIETIEVDEKYKIGIGHISLEMFKETNTTEEDTEGFVNIIRALKGVNIAVLLKQQKDGKFKVNLRSKDKFNLLPFVKKMGGGGHIKAAGFTSELPLIETKKIILEELRKML